MANICDTDKFKPLRGLLEILASDGLSSSQGKAILTKLSKIQRLAIAELIMNIVFCKTESVSEQEMERLMMYENQLRKIALLRKKVTNKVLAKHQMAVKNALKVALLVLNSSSTRSLSDEDWSSRVTKEKKEEVEAEEEEEEEERLKRR